MSDRAAEAVLHREERAGTGGKATRAARGRSLPILCAVLVTTSILAPGAARGALPFADALPVEALADAHEGAWAEYVTVVGGEPVGPWVRFLAGAREAGGRWIEVWISSRPGSASQAFRLLLDPAAPGGVARVRGRLLGGPIRDLPWDAPGGAGAAAGAWSTLGTESIQTAVGTLRTRRAELRRAGRRAATAWLDAAIPVLGLARLELANGAALEIHAWGSAGRSILED